MRNVYLVLIHLLLALVIVKSDIIDRVSTKFGFASPELPSHHQMMVDFYYRVDQNLPANSTLFIGDSHIKGLAVSAVSGYAVNYGIGGDTTVGVMKRLRNYQSLTSAKAVVLAIGFNDLRLRSNDEILVNLSEILTYLNARVKVVLCAVIPVGEKEHESFNERIRSLNWSLKNLVNRYDGTTYLDSFGDLLTSNGFLPAQYHLPDGVHLSRRGYARWISQLSISLNNLKN